MLKDISDLLLLAQLLMSPLSFMKHAGQALTMKNLRQIIYRQGRSEMACVAVWERCKRVQKWLFNGLFSYNEVLAGSQMNFKYTTGKVKLKVPDSANLTY
jgi:hypothetical protein